MRDNKWGDFVWWHGIVENRNDPIKLGRMQVRIVGYHTEDKVLIPTADLPWAVPMQPITSAAMNGIGQTPLGLVEGTNVIGFFRDGISAQDPVVMGSTGGMPQEKSVTSKGFNDPSGKYPLETHLKEPDTNRLAREDGIEHPVIQLKKDGVDKDVPIALTGKWTEPETPFAVKYPFNHVEESESGHIKEVDDTDGAERLHTYHKSGSFEEIHPDGTKVTKVVKDNYEIVAGNENVHISGDCNVTVNDNINIRSSSGNITIEVADGNCILNVQGNVDADITGNVTANIEGNTTADITGSLKVDVLGTTDITGTSPIKILGKSLVDIQSLGPLILAGNPIKIN